MSEIQRYSIEADKEAEFDTLMVPDAEGKWNSHADHLADRAELVRLLRAYREYHNRNGFACLDLRSTNRPDYRCELCKQVDALEGMK